jgi:hypothetical protein
MQAVGGNVADHDWGTTRRRGFDRRGATLTAFPNEIAMVRRGWEVWRADQTAAP